MSYFFFFRSNIWHIEILPSLTSGQKWTKVILDTPLKASEKTFLHKKDIVELGWSSPYITEEVWIVVMGTKWLCLIFKEGQKWTTISDMTWFIMVLDWYFKMFKSIFQRIQSSNNILTLLFFSTPYVFMACHEDEYFWSESRSCSEHCAYEKAWQKHKHICTYNYHCHLVYFFIAVITVAKYCL